MEDDDEDAHKVPQIIVYAPMQVIVYTISVFDLRSVHPFARNQPVVKAHTSRWKAATAVWTVVVV